MSATETPAGSDPRAQGAPPASKKRPWGWIALAGLLAAGVVALAIYAVNLNSDLDDANAKIASQQKEIDQAQDTGAGVAAAAKVGLRRAERQARRGAGGRESGGRRRRRSSWTTPSRRRRTPRAPPTSSRSRLDAAEAKAEAAATCAQSFLSAFSGVFDAATVQEGVEAAVAELQDARSRSARRPSVRAS